MVHQIRQEGQKLTSNPYDVRTFDRFEPIKIGFNGRAAFFGNAKPLCLVKYDYFVGKGEVRAD